MSVRFRLKAREELDVPGRKRAYNERHFAEAASRYDLATRMMSLGRDAAWKRALVAALPVLPSPRCVDLACGTGDVAFLLAKRYPGGVVTGMDLSAPMLAIARERNRFTNVRFEPGDLCDLPFSDGSADVVTGSYALRNAPDLREALAEVHRVAVAGEEDGVALTLDLQTARPHPPPSHHRESGQLLVRPRAGGPVLRPLLRVERLEVAVSDEVAVRLRRRRRRQGRHQQRGAQPAESCARPSTSES